MKLPKKNLPRTTTTAAAAATPPPPDISAIADSILKSTNPDSLTQSLHSLPNWPHHSVDSILKLLWNNGPKALEFFHLLDSHPSHRHSSSAFHLAIDISLRLRDYKSAWALLSTMRSRKLGPTPKTFAIITERYLSAGKPEKALNAFLSMHEHGCQQDLASFNAFLDSLCKSKRAEKAYELLKIFRGRFKADAVSYNTIANGFCLKKQTPRALEVTREMVERGLEPTLVTYNILLKGYFRAGQIKEGWDFFLEMKKRKVGIDVVTYTTLVHGLGVSGEVEKSRKVFDEMIGAGVLPSVPTYNALIQVLCKKDSVENALKVFDEMLKKGYSPNSTTYNVVIRGLCHAGKMETAVEYMERMRLDCDLNVQTFNVVIRYYCDAGEIEKGLGVFEKMNGGNGTCLPNLDTYNIMIGAMFVRKKTEDLVVAGKLLMEMVERGFLPRKFMFNRVLNGLMMTGNQGFAQEILRIQSRKGGLPRHFRL